MPDGRRPAISASDSAPPFIVRETPVDEFAGEPNAVQQDGRLVHRYLYRHRAFVEQFLQFENTFARQDDLSGLDGRFLYLHFRHREAVSIGADGAQEAGLQIEQQAVEVIADILMRHAELGSFEQQFQALLLKADACTAFRGRGPRKVAHR